MKLVLQNLGRQYRNGVWGLRALSLSFAPGVVGVVGPVGAGKTTLMRLLSTVISPTEGQALADERDIRRRAAAFRRRLGYLPQRFDVYAGLSARAFLNYVAAIKGVEAGQLPVAQAIDQVGLSEVADQKMGGYSLSLRRRVGLAQALLGQPRLLLIDEPGAALPAEERQRFFRCLEQVLAAGVLEQALVLIATENVADVASLAGRLVLLQAGQVVWDASPDELLRSVQGKVWAMPVDQTQLVEIKRQYLISDLTRQGERVQLRIVADASPGEKAAPVDPTPVDAYLYQMRRRNAAGL